MSNYRSRLTDELREVDYLLDPTGADVKVAAEQIDQRIGYSALVEALEAAREYVVGAYECGFPDEAQNAAVVQQIDAALAAARGDQMGNMGNRASSCGYENAGGEQQAHVTSPGATLPSEASMEKGQSWRA